MRNSKLLKKKKAVTMLEAIVSIFIIFIMFSVVVKLVQHNNKILEKREEIEQGHRVVYCIMQEIKYNISFNDVKELYNNELLKYKNYNELLSDLRSSSLNYIDIGEDIIVDIEEFNDSLNILISLYDDNSNLVVEREFLKYKWMDYYE
ncbi:hypothetical protein [Clostridium celatum]|uniref:hypothetical protein n=1 Tax=Clostridium celatum TaxID=36834 RepID=UPI001898D3D0|nr:hypothetical protein [Clostridium celatum]MDU6295801.1 hypothetical protein [Clostridium celatum]MDY3359282.1 hypothetical protein [Clostridium celatum]